MSMMGKGSVDSGGVGPEGSLTVDGWRCRRVAVSDDVVVDWMLGDDDGRRKAWHCWMEEDSRRSFVVDCIILLCFRHVMVDVIGPWYGAKDK